MQETLNLLLLNLDISNVKAVLLELNNQCISGTGLMTRVAAVQAMCYLTGLYVYTSILCMLMYVCVCSIYIYIYIRLSYNI